MLAATQVGDLQQLEEVSLYPAITFANTFSGIIGGTI
jgi:hypothetical protein